MSDDELDLENTDGPDIKQAQRALNKAQKDRVRTDIVIEQANQAIIALREMHRENHFVDKMRLIMQGRTT